MAVGIDRAHGVQRQIAFANPRQLFADHRLGAQASRQFLR